MSQPTELQLWEMSRQARKVVDSMQPSFDGMRILGERVQRQVDSLDLPALESMATMAEKLASQHAATLASLEPIGSRWASEVAASISAIQQSIPEWPLPQVMASMGIVAEQSSLLNESFQPGLRSAQVDLAAKVEAIFQDVDFEVVTKMVHLDVDHLVGLFVNDDGDGDPDVVEELVKEFSTDRASIEEARNLLRAVAVLVFGFTLEKSVEDAAEAYAVVDNAVQLLHGAIGDNPYLWLVGTMFTARAVWEFGVARQNQDEASQSAETDE